MVNAVYPKYKEAVLQAASNSALTGTLKCALVDTATYTYSASHQFLTDLSGIVGTAQTLATKTYVNGTLDADDVTYSGLSGANVEALVIYIDTGTAATSRLVAFIDTGQTGLPFTPSGGNVTVQWAAGGIFTI